MDGRTPPPAARPSIGTPGRVVTSAAAMITLAAGAFAVGAAIGSDGARPSIGQPAAPEPADAEAGAAQGGSPVTEVAIAGFEFAPLDVTLEAGASITWTNDDDVVHNVFTADGRFASDDLRFGDSYSVTVDEVGTIDYYCDIHQFMRGTITVVP